MRKKEVDMRDNEGTTPVNNRFCFLSRSGFPILLLAACWLAGIAPAAELVNEAYRVALQSDGAVMISAQGATPQRFEPCFTVIFGSSDPKHGLSWGQFKDESLKDMYNIENWSLTPGAKKKIKVDSKKHVDDGFDPATDRAAGAGTTGNLFKAGHSVTVTAVRGEIENGRVNWTFPAQEEFELRASLELPAGNAAPRLTWKFMPKKTGWWSVGYTGAPQVPPDKMDEMWQPMIWQEKRFPEDSFITSAFRCPLPTTLVTAGGITCGVVADPAELSFQPLPRFDNSRFGVAVRNASGHAQPMLFAPVFGGKGSDMQSGVPHTFSVRLLVHPGRCSAAYVYIARTLYGFHDYRVNAFCSLNRTLETMIAYGLSDYSRFNAELRGCSYDTDMPGSVKNISSLHPLGLAMVTDDETIFNERARPMIEYALSREKFLFTTKLGEKGTQSASSILNGPGGQVSEFVALYLMSQKRSTILLDAAETLFAKTRVLNLNAPVRGDIWPNALALYRATGQRQWLERAVKGADEYIARRIATAQTDFSDPDSRGMFFWTSFAPNWTELQLLYEETGEKRFLDAAVAGARQFSQFVWMCPAVPEADILVNEGGVAPSYRPRLPKIAIPEETAPAWRLSEIGLTPESAPTCKGHRAVFLACHAPWMLRLGLLANDPFLHDIARSAVVGRYTSFPGYHINTARTTVYEKPDFPLRSMAELNGVTSLHYNHIWAQIGMLMDYLVSDAFSKSDGKINFPGHYAEGYAYVQTKVYGDRPGTIYKEEDVWLWMPKGLAAIDNIQVNYLAARGKDSLYLVLMNQSPAEMKATVKLNKSLVNCDGELAVRVWKQNVPAEPATMSGGEVPFSIAGKGITVLRIGGIHVQSKFQARVFAPAVPLSTKSRADLEFGGGTKGMLLSFGPELTSAYVYTKATYETLKGATLHYRTGDQWKTMSDTNYPYEFTVPLEARDAKFEFFLEAVTTNGATVKSETATLER